MKDLIKKFIPPFLISWYHFSLSFLGALFYQFPSKKLKVIGITGTEGKTTVVHLAGKILEAAGFKVGWISSATLKISEKEWLNPYHMTMPGRFFLQKFLSQMVKEKCQYAVLEVTSEGIKQYRHKFINFDTAVFTNLGPEHIESHGGFEKYREAKGELFEATKGIHIVNLDDKNVEYFLKFPANKKYGYTLKSGRYRISTIVVKDTKISPAGLNFSINNQEFNLKLLGEFNVYNALAAICFGLSQGIDLQTIKRALERIEGIPGRMEFINKEQDFKIIIDLAHTPDSFEKVFKLVSDLPHNKIISIFGSAGGGRDKWKRPILGKIAARYSDFLILCNEDPYDENPLAILEAIEKGIQEAGFPKENYLKIEDRRKAIKRGLKMAKKGDIVLVLGKGTEQIMVIGSKKIPWDDRIVTREELKKIKNMKKYEILEHKADLKIRAYGKTKKELFLNMLLGMTSALRAEIKIKKIKIKSPDLPALLVDFLSEVLYLIQVNKEIYSEAKFVKFTDTELEAELIGQKVERFGEDIKAVTYHGLEVHQRPERSEDGRRKNILRSKDGIWEATVLFDI